MGKLKKKLRLAKRNTFSTGVIIIAVVGYNFFSKIPLQFFYWTGAAAGIGFLLWIFVSSSGGNQSYLNSDGYLVRSQDGELEHRYVATQVLNRKLKFNEVVHHINGQRIDNEIRNLCVMNSEKHELFHSWLSWKRKKNGKYPTISEQKRMLVAEYAGTLLDSYSPTNLNRHRDPVESMDIENKARNSNSSARIEIDPSKELFEKLRKERRRISAEKHVPAYFICNDKTLHEIVKKMPTCEADFSNIRGFGPSKIKNYGPRFIAVIEKFKSEAEVISKANSN
jgi:superfamily II DNA helicase RecQ